MVAIAAPTTIASGGALSLVTNAMTTTSAANRTTSPLHRQRPALIHATVVTVSAMTAEAERSRASSRQKTRMSPPAVWPASGAYPRLPGLSRVAMRDRNMNFA
jgi:hypothetical protein